MNAQEKYTMYIQYGIAMNVGHLKGEIINVGTTKTIVTRASHVVTHRTTDLAWARLTS